MVLGVVGAEGLERQGEGRRAVVCCAGPAGGSAAHGTSLLSDRTASFRGQACLSWSVRPGEHVGTGTGPCAGTLVCVYVMGVL